MKLRKFYAQYKSDIEAVAKFYNVNIPDLVPPGKMGCSAMWELFFEARRNRSSDDSHPIWKVRKRILPYDGSEYCEFFNIPGANDSHLETLLRKIYRDIVKERRGKNEQ